MASAVASPSARPVESKDDGLSEWLVGLYDVTQISEEEITLWYETYQYKGFERKQVLIELRRKVPNIKTSQQIIMICGMMGPQRAALTKIGNQTIESMGIPASGMKGSKGISCQRIVAATADLCAYLLKRIDIPRRLALPCPGWLQFPSAGSIKLPEDLRQLHYDFARRFSTVIGGIFNEQIYQQMMNNSYLDEKLGLFSDHIPLAVSSVQVPAVAPVFNPNQGSVGRTKTSATNKNKA